MSPSGTKTGVIERFLEYCCRSKHTHLGFLEVDEDVYTSPPEPAEVVSRLTEEFSIEDLVEFGIVEVAEDGAVALAPVLTGGTSFIALRDAITQEPYELLTPDGCITGKSLPLFEVLRDGRTQRLVEKGTGDLFVTYDLDHVAMLRACGLPATLAVGLDDLPLEQVGQLCESFDLGCVTSDRTASHEEGEAEHGNQSAYHDKDPFRPMTLDMMNDRVAEATQLSTAASAEPTQPIKARLIILGWTPLKLSNDVPHQLEAVANHLHQLQRFMGVELYDIGLWKVDEETIERLQFIAERRSDAIFKEALLEVAEDIDASITDFGKGQHLAVGPPNDYTTALARLHESSLAAGGSSLPGPNKRNEAWSDVQRLLRQQVVDPLREMALATTNPVERNLMMGFAELSNVFHLQSVVIGEQLSRRLGDRGIERGGQLPEDQFKNLMAMADRLIGMARATEKCNQPRTAIIESKTIDSPSFQQLPHSG